MNIKQVVEHGAAQRLQAGGSKVLLLRDTLLLTDLQRLVAQTVTFLQQ